ncbi:hypothetical protein GYA13_05295 [Candidatus Kuenenbacteria bacterium]|nr:hypothetical protein [Candidatus Kuenenbacteria bacterium]
MRTKESCLKGLLDWLVLAVILYLSYRWVSWDNAEDMIWVGIIICTVFALIIFVAAIIMASDMLLWLLTLSSLAVIVIVVYGITIIVWGVISGESALAVAKLFFSLEILTGAVLVISFLVGIKISCLIEQPKE